MRAELECVWLDVHQRVPLDDLAQMAGFTREEILELVDYGALPQAGGEQRMVFTGDCVLPLKEAARLRRAFDLDVFTAGLLFGYLMRLQALESELQSVRAGGPRPP